jgi:hypothetical protein
MRDSLVSNWEEECHVEIHTERAPSVFWLLLWWTAGLILLYILFVSLTAFYKGDNSIRIESDSVLQGTEGGK